MTTIETLTDTVWDVVLVGTGIQQSLLALALSRSDRKVLHVDPNDYYGGSEAALTLQQVEQWTQRVNEPDHKSAVYNAVLSRPEQEQDAPQCQLGPSRDYSLSLSPQIIFTRSNLLPALVSSRVHELLEFQAVGTWWMYEGRPGKTTNVSLSPPQDERGFLRKIPGSREDLFADHSIPLRAQRSLIKLMKLAADADEQVAITDRKTHTPFSDFLSNDYKIPEDLQPLISALTLSPNTPDKTPTGLAIKNIHQYLTSMGLFGPGFNAVVPKWGGLSEIAQVGCRAGAVGGGVYILSNGVETVKEKDDTQEGNDQVHRISTLLEVGLEGGEQVKTRWLVGTVHDLPFSPSPSRDSPGMSHLISIVASPLLSLFPPQSDGVPPPAASVVFFPHGVLNDESTNSAGETPPVYVVVHSADTGECPVGQCIIYAQTSASPGSTASKTLLELALDKILAVADVEGSSILYTLMYNRSLPPAPQSPSSDRTSLDASREDGSVNTSNVIGLAAIDCSTIALENTALHSVRKAWERITAEDKPEDKGTFLVFPERETEGRDEEGCEDG